MCHSTPTKQENTRAVKPLCPLFGQCGGCQYQDHAYPDECRIKFEELSRLLESELAVDRELLSPIVPSPLEYHYRCRLDMKLLKTRGQEIFIGFSPAGRNRVVEVSDCPLALPPISGFLPELKKQAAGCLPAKYRNANLVVKTGDDGRVFWGGIGRRSLRMKEEDFLWTAVKGKKVHFSLDTFFQANLSILPLLIDHIIDLGIFHPDITFFDLYGGVGLFGICLADHVRDVVLVEENIYATRCAEYNAAYHGYDQFKIVSGRMEDVYAGLAQRPASCQVAMIDPPRKGLTPQTAVFLAARKDFGYLLYLSCHRESLIKDLDVFLKNGWKVRRIIPFDFFPKTKHLETLVLLSSL